MVSPIGPYQRHVVILYKKRYTEQEKRIIFRRGLLDWLLPIGTLPSVFEIPDEMQVVFKELTRDGDKSMVVKTNLIGRKR